MDTAGREAKNYVTLTNRGFPEYFILIDNADGKPGQIVILRLHGAGVLRGFTADQTDAVKAVLPDAVVIGEIVRGEDAISIT